MAGWAAVQVAVLRVQDLWGARCVVWGMERGWVYERDGGGGEVCAVCLGGEGVGWAGTPCGHVFHMKCLEEWGRLRLVCPVCRMGLPAM